ncbi:hypothetical protein, partial [Aeromonas caviae]|uniref:hypothetical protein n=1 Tax=Aeromonas caviae TaxID=648 RepID=UPI002B46B1E2
MNKREIHLDVIRIVACLAVILFHYNVYLLYADPKVARIGEISYLHQTYLFTRTGLTASVLPGWDN